MSVTTTANPLTSSVLQVLTDYDLHHSRSPETPQTAPVPNRRSDPSPSNPPEWPTNHRAVPPYRPADRNLDREQRPGGMNAAEVVFIFTMLNGVRINAVRIFNSKKIDGADRLVDGKYCLVGYTWKAE
jgi:hypothetical protein